MKSPLPIFILPLLLMANATATTIITNNGRSSSSVVIAQTFGDNISVGTVDITVAAGINGTIGTPNVGLGWSATGGSNAARWEHHIAGGSTPSAGGGALQMDGSQVGSTYSVTFTPDAGYGVVLGSFNFLNDTTGGNVNYNYTINLVDVTNSTTVYTSNFNFNPSISNTVPLSTITVNTTGAIGSTLRLEFVRSAAVSGTEGSAVDIYIDNLRFDQVPEPSAALLGAIGVLGLLRRRRA